ncbi:RraA family protein [Rhodovulum euryhalinum]|uniref:Putative 4-hydroxy-4-methyl-2-oxoglutarate aldolase n=1 Tax=Rhodovulum euryhalinum TaxID=35805 RepID=A0A4R2KMG0_9RHOB|nr:RraA family protein [Rhodovulum euryhalinum]TCO71939.1 4-hydroxy-4-methyl-2-oxoglutarate aldolase [Rhodovulum euryhalinum]
MIEEPPILTIRPPKRRPSAAQIAAFQGVPTGFVCDAMEGRGALSPAIAPLGGGRDIDCRAAGPALTALNRPSDILATLAALDHVQPGDIVVAAFGGFQGCAALGDLVTGMMKNAGAAGVVTDGPMRDYAGLVQVGLPAWCTGLNPNSPFATGPGEVGGPVEIGGRTVETGDMIVADRDGVVVVPFARIDAVIARLAEVGRLEAETEARVAAGARQLVDIGAMIADGRAVVLD